MVELIVCFVKLSLFIEVLPFFIHAARVSKYTWVPAFVNCDTSRLQYYNPKNLLYV